MGASPNRGPSGTAAGLVVVNPLGGALRHYTARLAETLEASGVKVEVLTVFEPSDRGGSRAGWLLRYLRTLISARRRGHPRRRVLVTWPVLGHLDRLMIRAIVGGQNSTLVMHDPNPLVRAVGYRPAVVALASRIASDVSILVHSQLAQRELAAQGLSSIVVAHPLIASGDAPDLSDRQVVRVLGQWKPDRDIELLQMIGPMLPGVELEVVGRGWPPVDHWRVRDAFVTENELDALIAGSSAVLIPYRRFYQSGIAARALEAAVPVVGRKQELAEMTGSGYPFLVDDQNSAEGWASTIRAALSSDPRALEEIRTATARRSLESWQEWART